MTHSRTTLPRRSSQVVTRAGQERLLNRILTVSVVLITGGLLVALLFNPARSDQLIQLGGVAVALWILALGRRIRYDVRATLTVAIVYGAALLNMVTSGVSDQGRITLMLFILFVLTLLGTRAAIGAVLVSAASLGVVGLMQATGRWPVSEFGLQLINSGENWALYTMRYGLVLVVIGYLVQYIVRDQLGALRRQQELSNALEEQRTSLEVTVAERTRALNLAADFGRQLTQILRRDELLRTFVEQVRAAFDYYYVQVYLVDEDDRRLELVSGSGEVGRELVRRGHRLDMGQGLVGRAANTASSVLIPNVNQASGWLPNPLLPNTRSELAVPILVGDRVLGVLDVQHDVTGGLTESDQDLLESIAGQMAVALRNSEILAVTSAKAERAAQRNRLREAIQQTTDLDSLARVATRELAAVLRASTTRVTLYPRRLRPLLLPREEDGT